MDSPITREQLRGCIDGLKRANRSEFVHFRRSVIWICVIVGIVVIDWWLMTGMASSDFGTSMISSSWGSIIIYCAALIVGCMCYLMLATSIQRWARDLMYSHVTPVFAKTALVDHVLGLPTAIMAYQGWLNAWLAGGLAIGKRAPYDMRRRVKAVIERFHAWSRHFRQEPEPLAIRLAIRGYVLPTLIYAVSCTWLADFQFSSTQLQQNPQGAFYFRLGFSISIALLGLWQSVIIGRRTGIRMALIDYFTAEAARGDVMVTEDGASDE